MVVRSTTTPSAIQYYSGSGQLAKSSGTTVAASVRSFRFWKDKEGESKMAVFDFSDANVVVLDSLLKNKELCRVKLLDRTSVAFVKQLDSLLLPVSVDIERDGKTIRSYRESSWKSLTMSEVPELQAGDIITFRTNGATKDLWGYEEYTLNPATLRKDDQAQEQPPKEVLIPREFSFSSYPNPFNPSTTLMVQLPTEGRAKLAVYDIIGREVAMLMDGNIEAGVHTTTFDANKLPSGLYFARLSVTPANGKMFVQTVKMLLTK